MTAPVQPSEDVAAVMADVMRHQASVSRAEATLSAARGRLGASLDRLARATRDHGVDVPPLAAAVIQCNEGLPAPATAEERSATPGEPMATLRDRIAAVLDASPEQVFTAALVARALKSRNRDSIRNTLLVLAAKGRIDKLGPGEYRARKTEATPAAPEASTP